MPSGRPANFTACSTGGEFLGNIKLFCQSIPNGHVFAHIFVHPRALFKLYNVNKSESERHLRPHWEHPAAMDLVELVVAHSLVVLRCLEHSRGDVLLARGLLGLHHGHRAI